MRSHLTFLSLHAGDSFDQKLLHQSMTCSRIPNVCPVYLETHESNCNNHRTLKYNKTWTSDTDYISCQDRLLYIENVHFSNVSTRLEQKYFSVQPSDTYIIYISSVGWTPCETRAALLIGMGRIRNCLQVIRSEIILKLQTSHRTLSI